MAELKVQKQHEEKQLDVEIRTAPIINGSESPTSNLTALFRRKHRNALGEIATQPSVYDDPEKAKYFKPHDRYENLHRFDPSLRWTWAEELPLLRKIDWKVTAWSAIAFFALDLDRSNLSQANTDNFLEDLGLDTNDFNLGNTIFKVVFLFAELPSQLISKKIGPDRWIPAQMILWSIVAASQFRLSGRKSFLACRALLGLLQGGFIPDVVLYLSYFFTGTELPFRLALFWMANRLTDVIAPLLAYGILRLRGYHGYEGWRWLFLLEGILTLVIGIWSAFMMAPSPTQTRAWYRPKGWFTEREEKILVNRILRDDPSKGDMHNRQAITPKLLWKSICDFDIWPLYAIGLTFGIPAGPPDQYLTLTLRNLGFDTFQSNLLSIPAQIGTTVCMLVMTYFSERIRQRAALGLFTQLWFLPCVIALAVLPENASKWGSSPDTSRLVQSQFEHCQDEDGLCRFIQLFNISVQVQAIISSNIYRTDDKPLYRRGNRVLVAINSLNIVLYVAVKLYYSWRNKQKDKAWENLTAEEKIEYIDSTSDEGSKRLDFRFVS